MRYGMKTKTLKHPMSLARPTNMDLIKVWTIYAMVVCLEKKTYFKIGRTNRIESRITSVQCGCPVPIDSVLRVDGLKAAESMEVEKAIQQGLTTWHSSGEWFCFDLHSMPQKRAFKQVCDRALSPLLGPDWKWVVASVEETRRHGVAFSERRRNEWELQRKAREKDPAEDYNRSQKGLMPGFWDKKRF